MLSTEKRKGKKLRKELDEQEIKASKLQLRRIEKLIIRKKKEILQEKSRILKQKAFKLCVKHQKIRGLEENRRVVEQEITDAVYRGTDCAFTTMEDFYIWAFNDSKKKLQRVSVRP